MSCQFAILLIRPGRDELRWLDRAAKSITQPDAKDNATAPAEDSIPWNRRQTLQLLHREAEKVLKEKP